MNILSRIRYLLGHPLNKDNKLKAVLRILKWQVGTRLNPYPIIYQFTEHSKLVIKRGMTGATGNVYCGLHEYHDMGFLLHLLRKDDCFADIGANIGSYTVLASGQIGATTYSFEPVPATFAQLTDNISINQVKEKVISYNVALGSARGSIGFNIGAFDTMNHVAEKNEAATIQVPVEILDDILSTLKVPLLIKIDVEGFETEVIRGAMKTLRQQELKAIIIELNGSGARYGYDEKEIHTTLASLHFLPYQYDPKERRLIVADSSGGFNTIYIRDLDFVKQRLETAPAIKILDSKL